MSENKSEQIYSILVRNFSRKFPKLKSKLPVWNGEENKSPPKQLIEFQYKEIEIQRDQNFFDIIKKFQMKIMRKI